jgi:hypothetical protein
VVVGKDLKEKNRSRSEKNVREGGRGNFGRTGKNVAVKSRLNKP